MQSSLIVFAILAVPSKETKAASDRTAFDGTWSVTLNAHDDAVAQFKGRHGTGKRIGGRIGIFDFVKD
jgi:hypothetical protein